MEGFHLSGEAVAECTQEQRWIRGDVACKRESETSSTSEGTAHWLHFSNLHRHTAKQTNHHEQKYQRKTVLTCTKIKANHRH